MNCVVFVFSEQKTNTQNIKVNQQILNNILFLEKFVNTNKLNMIYKIIIESSQTFKSRNQTFDT